MRLPTCTIRTFRPPGAPAGAARGPDALRSLISSRSSPEQVADAACSTITGGRPPLLAFSTTHWPCPSSPPTGTARRSRPLPPPAALVRARRPPTQSINPAHCIHQLAPPTDSTCHIATCSLWQVPNANHTNHLLFSAVPDDIEATTLSKML